MERAPSLEPLSRFAASAVVGLLATVTDLIVLTSLVEIGHLAPTAANVPALLAGALVQFVGNRHVFRANDGPIARQAFGFVLAEVGTMALNAIAYHLLVTTTPIPYVLARPIGQAIVYVGFSYPMWQRVFRASS